LHKEKLLVNYAGHLGVEAGEIRNKYRILGKKLTANTKLNKLQDAIISYRWVVGKLCKLN